MIVARVTGSVWASKRLDEFPSGALLEVTEETTGQTFIALDSLGCGPDDRVLVVRGSAAARRFHEQAPIDALIVGIIDIPSG